MFFFSKAEDDRPTGYQYPPPSVGSVSIVPDSGRSPSQLTREDAEKIREAVVIRGDASKRRRTR